MCTILYTTWILKTVPYNIVQWCAIFDGIRTISTIVQLYNMYNVATILCAILLILYTCTIWHMHILLYKLEIKHTAILIVQYAINIMHNLNIARVQDIVCILYYCNIVLILVVRTSNIIQYCQCSSMIVHYCTQYCIGFNWRCRNYAEIQVMHPKLCENCAESIQKLC